MKLKDILVIDMIKVLDFISLGTLKEAIAVSNWFSNDVKAAVRGWNNDYKTNYYVDVEDM